MDPGCLVGAALFLGATGPPWLGQAAGDTSCGSANRGALTLVYARPICIPQRLFWGCDRWSLWP